MWVSKRKWRVLTERVDRLENAERSREYRKFEPDPNNVELHTNQGANVRAIHAHDLLRAIIDHLRLRVVRIPNSVELRADTEEPVA